MSGKMTKEEYIAYRKGNNPHYGEKGCDYLPKFLVKKELKSIRAADTSEGYPGDSVDIDIPAGKYLTPVRLANLSSGPVYYAEVTLGNNYDGKKTYSEIAIPIQVVPTGSIGDNIEITRFGGGRRHSTRKTRHQKRKTHRRHRKTSRKH